MFQDDTNKNVQENCKYKVKYPNKVCVSLIDNSKCTQLCSITAGEIWTLETNNLSAIRESNIFCFYKKTEKS